MRHITDKIKHIWNILAEQLQYFRANPRGKPACLKVCVVNPILAKWQHAEYIHNQSNQ